MDMDWSHAPETSISYHQTGPDTRQKKTRPSNFDAKEHVEKGPPDRHQDDRIHLESH